MISSFVNPSGDENDNYHDGEGYHYPTIKAFFSELNDRIQRSPAELGNTDRTEALAIFGSESTRISLVRDYFRQVMLLDGLVEYNNGTTRVGFYFESNGVWKRVGNSYELLHAFTSEDKKVRTEKWVEITSLAMNQICIERGVFFNPFLGLDQSTYLHADKPHAE